MKRFISCITLFLITVLLVFPVFSDTFSPKFVDNSGLCSYSEVQNINAFLEEKSGELGFEITALIESTIGGRDVQDYADLYYENNYVADSDGILFMLVLDTREWCFSTSGRGISFFNENDFDDLINSMLPYLKSGDYSSAVSVYSQDTAKYIEWINNNAYDISDSGYYYHTQESNAPRELRLFDSVRLVWSAIIGGVAGLIGVSSMKSKMNNVHRNSSARDYVRKNSLNLTRSNDMFLNKTVSQSLRATQNKTGGSSFHSGGSTHVSSSGHSHGGSHGHF